MGRRPALVSCVALLAVHNVAGNLWLPEWAYVPVNLAAAAVLVGLASRAGLGAEQIAGPRAWVGRGLLAGLVLGGTAVVLVAVAAALPAAGDAFTDDRAAGIGALGLVYHVAVRIPLGTALFEEVAFRGVLPALGRAVASPRRADAGSALLFGLWHVIPAWSVAAGNEAASQFAGGVVVTGAVAGTAVAGLGLSWLRNRHGLAAPVVLHAAVNGAALSAAWIVA